MGGWAEEALGLSTTREHSDIDLIVELQNFKAVDELLSNGILKDEISAKRFHHKRAFVFRGTRVELYRVENRDNCRVTDFWGDVEYRWLDPLTVNVSFFGHPLRVVTAANLLLFRTTLAAHQYWRWKDPLSLVRRDQ